MKMLLRAEVIIRSLGLSLLLLLLSVSLFYVFWESPFGKALYESRHNFINGFIGAWVVACVTAEPAYRGWRQLGGLKEVATHDSKSSRSFNQSPLAL